MVILAIAMIMTAATIWSNRTGNNSSADNTGKMCTNSLEGHTLAEVGITNGQAKVSQFGSPDAPAYCRDSGDNGKDGFDGSKRPDGCDSSNPDNFFAAVCPGGGSKTCGGGSWWHLKKLIVTYNGKSVTVTVRDRGPNPSTGRQLDLSYAAMKTLGASTDATVSVCLAGSGSAVSSGDIVSAAEAYLNRGIRYSKAASLRCGPKNSTGPNGVIALDCSGYVSRVYHDAGFLSSNWCQNTTDIALDSRDYMRIATSVTQAKSILQPGDVILFGLGNPYGAPDHGDNSHAVIFGGMSGSNEIVYESTTSHGISGPRKSIYNVFGGGRQLYGVYRATKS